MEGKTDWPHHMENLVAFHAAELNQHAGGGADRPGVLASYPAPRGMHSVVSLGEMPGSGSTGRVRNMFCDFLCGQITF